MRLRLILISLIFSFAYQSQLDHCDDFLSDKEDLCSQLKGDNGEDCLLIDNDCKAVFLKCSDYAGQDKDVCESIKIYDIDKHSYKTQSTCKLEGTNCVQKLKECDDKTLDQCVTIIDLEAEGDKTRRCGTINGKCAEYVDNCADITDFEGDPNKNTCIDNLPTDSTNKCKYGKPEGATEDSCYSDYTNCEQYLGSDQATCLGLTPVDTENKICIFYDGKCLEKYKTCGNAKNKEACESSYPLNDDKSVKTGKECVWKIPNSKTEYECVEDDISTSDPPITTCPTGVTKEKCQSTILPQDHMRCVFDDSDSSCTAKPKTCSYYKSISLQKTCESYKPYFTKKCVFSDEDCLDKNKSCNELASANGVTAKICENAPTSDSKKKCSLKSDKSGCQEVDIPQDNSQASSGESNNQNNNSDNIKSKLIFVFLCLLFL